MGPLVRLADRADFATEVDRAHLGPRVRVLDLQPSTPLREGDETVSGTAGQCVSCTMVDFLRSQAEIARYDGLAPLRTLLVQALDLATARRRGDARTVAAIARSVGARSVLQLRDPERPREGLAVPTVTIARSLADLDEAPGAVLLEPTRTGRALLVEMAHEAARRGTRAYVGYAEHASAIDGFADFVESERDGGILRRLAFDLRELAPAPFLIAFPPCAALQWGGNRQLERERARADVVFRGLAGESSLMCAENVSGYSLVEGSRTTLGSMDDTRWVFRWDDLLLAMP